MFMILAWIVVVFGFLHWLGYAVIATLNARSIPALRDLSSPEPKTFPRLSLIVPACNEADTLEQALQSKLAEDYPNLEYILINDRSTDSTGEVMERMARRDSRIKVLHIKQLPKGWLGKVHALHQGIKVATGEWLLFSDADVRLERGTLRKAIAYALARGLDHVAAIPQLQAKSFWLDVAVALFSRVPMMAMRRWDIENPKSKGSTGIGAFNLVRREAFDRTPGFEWLRLEVGDDVGLGLMLKQNGGKQTLVHGRGSVEVLWYETFSQMLHGTEKVWLASIGNYSPPGIYVFTVIWWLLEMSPFLAFWLSVPLALVMVILAWYTAFLASRFNNQAVLPALVWPIGSLILVISATRAAFVAQKQGGLVWRGTLYTLNELRQGKRFRAF